MADHARHDRGPSSRKDPLGRERGFIRAEVVPWDGLVAAGSFARAREQALVRTEGKDDDAPPQEGDVTQIRFNV